MRGHKLKCGVWWQGVLKAKGVKEVKHEIGLVCTTIKKLLSCIHHTVIILIMLHIQLYIFSL
jgi:hypothetical protein